MIATPLQAALAAYYAALESWAEAQARAALFPSPQGQQWALARKAVLEQARAVLFEKAGSS